MGDHDHRAAAKALRRRPERRLRFGIHGRCGFVQDEDRRIAEDGPRDPDALALARRQTHAAIAEYGAVAVRQPRDEAVRTGRPRRRLDRRRIRRVLPVGDVRRHRVVEEHRLLPHETDEPAEGVYRELPDVRPIDRDPSRLRVRKPGQQVDQRGLPAPGRPDDGDDGSARDDEVDAPQRGPAPLVGEADALVADLPLGTRRDPRPSGRLRVLVEDLEEAVRRGEPLRGDGRILRERLHRRDGAQRDGHEGDELLGRDRPTDPHERRSDPDEAEGHDGREHFGEGRGEVPGRRRCDPLAAERVRTAAKAFLLEVLGDPRLHDPHRAQRFLQRRDEFAVVIPGAAEPFPQPAEQRPQTEPHERHQDDGDERQPPRESEQRRRVRREGRDLAHGLRERIRHDGLRLPGVRDHARDQLPHLSTLEEGERQVLQVRVNGVAHVADEKLLRADRERPPADDAEVLEEERGQHEHAHGPQPLQSGFRAEPPPRDPVDEALRRVPSAAGQGRPHTEERAEERDEQEEAERLESGREHAERQAREEGPPIGTQEPEQPPVRGCALAAPARSHRVTAA